MSQGIEPRSTRRIRIAVAIDDRGRWYATGSSGDRPGDAARYALDGLDGLTGVEDTPSAVVHTVEADVPLPTPRTIEGIVSSWLDEPEKGMNL
jgi:hypothetical protein